MSTEQQHSLGNFVLNIDQLKDDELDANDLEVFVKIVYDKYT